MTKHICNKVKRVAMLAIVGAMVATVLQAQETVTEEKALHLFFKGGVHEQVDITDSTQVEFMKQPYLEEEFYRYYGDTIRLSAMSGRTSSFGTVDSNVDWTISTDADWLVIRKDKLPEYFMPMGDGIMGVSFLVFAEANDSEQERTATVTIDTEHGLSKQLVVYQYPYQLSFQYMCDAMGYDPTTTMQETIAWSDTVYYAYLYPNFGVELVSYPDWLEFDYIAYGNDYFSLEKVLEVPDDVQVTRENVDGGCTLVKFRMSPNRLPESRTGELVFEGHGQQAVLTLTQEGLSDIISLRYLEAIQKGMIEDGNNHDEFSHMSVLHATDMMASDMTMFNLHWFQYDYLHENNAPTYRRNRHTWNTYYNIVLRSNAAIDFVETEKAYLNNADFVLGNAYAYRAMAYLYLIQLFQNPTVEGGIGTSLPGVPMLYASHERENMTAEQIEYFKGRNTVGEVFAQIEADITRAITLLQGQVRPSKNYIDITVAQGIAARYYLLAQEWEKAAQMAKAARSSYELMDGTTIGDGIRDGFMNINNKEWMWGFDHTEETTTMYASFFSHMSNIAPGYSGMGYTGRGIDAYLFRQMSDSDYRRAYWYRDENGHTESTSIAHNDAIMSERPYAILKFGWDGYWTMDYLYMRAAEMLLIEAEAYAQLGDGESAAETLRELMDKRDPGWFQTFVNVPKVLQQRSLELIGEGHAYFDLKRFRSGIDRNYSGSNHHSSARKTVSGDSPNWTYKIPITAIDDDVNFNLTEADNQ